MSYKNTIILFSLSTFSACTIENKMHSLVPPMSEGQCDIANPSMQSSQFKPIAVCQSTSQTAAPLRESIDVLGQESYDPNGFDIIDYSWKLVEQPLGSTVSFSDRSANGYGFTPDLAGTYAFELVVTNDRCIQSDPCRVELEAVPKENLWIELSWEHPYDDMDLHLISNDAQFESEGDCYYGNCVSDYGTSLNWGRIDDFEDDPRLDLDDIEGRGPENINIAEPSNGSYKIVVHDYPGSEFFGENRVFVRIHLDGELVFDRSVVIEGEDSITDIAIVEWPSLELQPLIP